MKVAKDKISKVAIYLRKSRVEETEADLLNHRTLLEDVCKENRWNYDIYMEKGSTSSQDIEIRDAWAQLCEKISNYDGVLVVEQARISRSLEDSAMVKRVLIQAGVYLIIHKHIWDLSDPMFSKMYDFNSFIGSMEYSETSHRLQLGKKMRFLQGKWVNGPAPFGYKYNRGLKQLEIEEVEKETYDYIKSRFLVDEWSTNQIAYDLNKRGREAKEKGEKSKWLTRKNNYWKNKTVIDLLTNMVHLGVVVSGKEKGSLHKDRKGKSATPYKQIDKSDWKVVQGEHPAIKTPEEHTLILYRLQKSRLNAVSKCKTRKIYSLSGLVVCGLCGSLIGVIRKDTDDKDYLKKCHYKDAFGVKCPNKSIRLDYVEDALLDEIKQQQTIVEQITTVEDYKQELMQIRTKELSELEDRKLKLERILKVIYDSYEQGVYSVQEFLERRKDIEEELETVRVSIEALKSREEELIKSLEQDRVARYKAVIDEYNNEETTPERKNELLKCIIDKIVYTRAGEKGTTFSLEVKFKA